MEVERDDLVDDLSRGGGIIVDKRSLIERPSGRKKFGLSAVDATQHTVGVEFVTLVRHRPFDEHTTILGGCRHPWSLRWVDVGNRVGPMPRVGQDVATSGEGSHTVPVLRAGFDGVVDDPTVLGCGVDEILCGQHLDAGRGGGEGDPMDLILDGIVGRRPGHLDAFGGHVDP